VDDDAAGHGWSTARHGVQAGKVDLFSTMVHEFGHILGYEHDELGASLAVGERHLPFEPDYARNDHFQIAAASPCLF